MKLRKKCVYLELFLSLFSRIRTEYEETRSISPYSVRMRENMDQDNFEYGQFSRSVNGLTLLLTLRKRCLYLELFWSAFSHIWTEYEDIRSISPYSVRMRENADQYNSKYRHFLRSVDESVNPLTLRENCPYSELSCSTFSRIRTEYGEILRTSSYSVRMWENADQNNSENGQFPRSAKCNTNET